MISTLLDRLFQRSNVPSGAQVKHRLKFILAHDRAAIEPQVFANMRQEIMRVVSKYVELDENALDIRLESDKRMTALIANLPIRMVREDLPDLQVLFDQPSQEDTELNKSSSSTMEMDMSAEAALDAIAAKEIIKSLSESISPESIAIIAERTTEVTSILRTAVNKSQNSSEDDRAEVEIDEINMSDDSASITSGEELDEQPSDQLELSLELPDASQSQEVVIDEASQLYNQAQE